MRTKEKNSWFNMRGRCNNPNNKDYGGRGIEVRYKSFEEFLSDVGPAPGPKYSIDRIDNNGHYEKGNCRWATNKQQSNNKRQNVYLTIDGVTKPVLYWSKKTGLECELIRYRKRQGWEDKDCIKPVRTFTTEGYRGKGYSVTYDNRTGRFQARIIKDRKGITVGQFDTKKQAEKACKYCKKTGDYTKYRTR